MKNIKLTLLLLFQFTLAFGQFGNEEIVNSDNSTGINNINTSDLDGDGDLDVVFYSFSKARLCFIENTFPEDYQKPSQILMDSLYEVSYFTVGDMDQDGDEDIIYCVANQNTLYWIEQSDNFTFTAPQLISNNLDNIRKVELADLDGDEDLDIVTVSLGDNKIVWFENLDITDGYGPEQILSTELDGAIDIGVSDFDLDNDLDVFACSVNDGKIVFFENTDGQGNFSSTNLIKVMNDVRKIVLKDLDSDGYPDIIVGSYDDDKFVWYQNQGGFGLFSDENFIVSYDKFSDFDIADMDSDGDMDFIISSYSIWGDDGVTWYENDNNTFTNPRVLNSRQVFGFELTDLNEDNQIDLVYPVSYGSTSPIPGELMYSKNMGDADNFQNNLLEISYESYCDIAVGDVDNDGISDVVSASTNLILYRTQSEEPFQRQNIKPFIVLGNATIFHKVDLHDLNGDDYLDMIFCTQYGLYYRLNDGTGDYDGSTGENINGGDYNDFEVADLDNDGDVDMVSCSDFGLHWWQNNNGSFNTEKEIYEWSFSTNNTVNAEVGDMDNDGDIDVICGFQTGYSGVYFFENIDGQGTFAAPVILDDNIDCHTVKITDVNGDGNLDIVTNEYADGLYWIQNMGNGTYASAIPIPVQLPNATSNADIFTFDVGDIDLDGHVDVFACEANTFELFWLSNSNGQGNFDNIKIIHQLKGIPYTGMLHDLNKDGDLDIFVASLTNQSQISYFENSSFMVNTDELEFANENIKIFPNPTDNILTIEPIISKYSEVDYQIFDAKGELILANQIFLFPNNTITINVSDFPVGTYFFQVEFDGKFISKKIIIQR